MATDAELPERTERTTAGTIGTVLTRLIVPGWVLAGAIFKLVERDPRLLPKPILDTVAWLGGNMNLDDSGFASLLDTSMRILIGIEFALVAVMFFVPLLARKAAIFTLTVFLAILACVLVQEYMKTGWTGVLGGSCGCFGAGGPPPYVMFLIDFVLLLGVIIFRPNRSRGGVMGVTLGFVVALAGMATALLVPGRTIAQPAIPDAATDAVVSPDDGAGSTGEGSTADAAASRAWPAAGELPNMFYPQFEKWRGQALRDQVMARHINRPLPKTFDTGRWHIVFYRGDCEHCHDLIDTYVVDDVLARTLLVRVPDTDPAQDLPLPERPFRMHHLPEGPTYVFTTPILLTMDRGIVVGVAEDSTDDAAVEAALNATGEAASVPGSSAPASPPATPAAPATPVAPAEAAGQAPATTSPPPAAPPVAPPAATDQPAGAASPTAWPPAPPLANMYFPQFEKWPGQRLDAQAIALQAKKPLPALNTGRWHVIFYRGDCDHCHELIDTFIVDDRVERTLLIRVPDTEPEADLPLPDRAFTMTTLPEGPAYVLTTPVLLTIVDGVITCVAEDSEDLDAVNACLATE